MENQSFNQRLLRSVSPIQPSHSPSPIPDRQQISIQTSDRFKEWAKRVQGNGLTKSVVLAPSQSTIQSNNLNLPEKLLKMKERVQRERSANAEKETENQRDDSLYGRKKSSAEVRYETQKVIESQPKFRKPQSKSTVSEARRPLLDKHKFKEDPFDQEEIKKERGPGSYDRVMGGIRQSDKENDVMNSGMNVQINRYKRQQIKSNLALATYQEKYARLEKNFKKFSNNIRHANQTEEVINSFKLQTGLSHIHHLLAQSNFRFRKLFFAKWRLNSGLAHKIYQNQQKTVVIARCANKINQRTLNHVKILYYQRWKRMALQQWGADNSVSISNSHVIGQLSNILVDATSFNQCVESDFYLSRNLNAIIRKTLNGVISSDILFLQPAQDESQVGVVRGYNDQSGKEVVFRIDNILSNCLLAKVANMDENETESEDLLLSVVESIQQHRNFCEQIDLPVNHQSVSDWNRLQDNQFNKIRDLSLIQCEIPKIGYLRLYYNAEFCRLNVPSNIQVKQAQQFCQVLPQFLQRIFEVRNQINSLALTSIDQAEVIKDLETYHKINVAVNRIQTSFIQKHLTLQSSDQVMAFVKEEIESVLNVVLQLLSGTILRELLEHDRERTSVLVEDRGAVKNLVRQNDHIQEDKEVIEDFLDYKKDFLIHQISIRPKIDSSSIAQFSNFTFILQSLKPYQSQRQEQFQSPHLSGYPENEGVAQDDKHRICYLFKILTPVLINILTISRDLKIQLETLSKEKEIAESEREMREELDKSTNEYGLVRETAFPKFTLALQSAITQAAYKFFENEGEEMQVSEVVLIINRTEFLPQPVLGINQLYHQYAAVLLRKQAESTRHLIFNELNKGFEFSKQQQQREIFDIVDVLDESIDPSEGLVQIGVGSDLFGRQITVLQDSTFVIPMNGESKSVQLGVLILRGEGLQERKISRFRNQIQNYLIDLHLKRLAYLDLYDQHQRLLQQLDGERVSQETKHIIDRLLILPFLKKQSLKAIGEGIDALADILVMNGPQGSPGQDINQIAYLSAKTYIEDVRLLQTYRQIEGQKKQRIKPDDILAQAYRNKQQIVYEDMDLGRLVILFPIIQQGFASRDQSHSAVILRFVIDKDSDAERKLKNIQSQLILPIQNVIQHIIAGGAVMLRHSLGVEKMGRLIDRSKLVAYREILTFMRDLKAKGVFNFSRCRLFDAISRSKRFIQLKNSISPDSYFDHRDQEFKKRQLLETMMRESIMKMNKYAQRYLLASFKRFFCGTKKPVYAEMSKKKKRGLTTLMNHICHTSIRSAFLRFVVGTQCYSKLKHPKHKYLSSIHCIQRNFRVIRLRLAYLKLKKNLNMYLRESMKSYVESDKDLFIQLNQILLSSYGQNGGLEGGFSYALNEIFNYLKNQLVQDQYVREFMNMAHPEGHLGHLDEVVISIKSQVFTSHSGKSNSLNTQKMRVFCSQLSEIPVINRRGQQSIKIQYDKEIGLSQKQQLLNRINNSNVENQFEQESNMQLYDMDIDRQLGVNFSGYLISQKRDLIHQMLEKSNGITFNFQNIQQSLSDIFLQQQSQHRDQNIGNRIATVKRSKSALIIPLFDVSRQVIIGSLELYKYVQLAFSDEVEQRYTYFANRLSDFFLLYGQLKTQIHQIHQLKQQLQKNAKPSSILSQVLKSVYLTAPGNHFPGASHVLPILIQNQRIMYGSEIDGYFMRGNEEIQQKLAFVYSFKDNNIYNFDFEGTFIQEIIDNACILEMCQKNNSESMREGQILNQRVNSQLDSDPVYMRENNSAFPFQAISENQGLLQPRIISNQTDPHETDRTASILDGSSNRSRNIGIGTGLTHSMSNAIRNRAVQSSPSKVKSVTNEFFKHLVYYPVFDEADESKIVAILEVGFKSIESGYEIISDDILVYIETFRQKLSQIKLRIGTLAKSVERVLETQIERKKHKSFQFWRHSAMESRYQGQIEQLQEEAQNNQEVCYHEYLQNLDNYSTQINILNSEKEQMGLDIDQFILEKRAKLKFLATSLISSHNLFKRVQNHRLRKAFKEWQASTAMKKLAVTAFNRVVELNHRHSVARYKAGVFMLSNLKGSFSIKQAFDCICDAAQVRRTVHYLAGGMDNSRIGENIRGKSRGMDKGEQSYSLNNMTSLLSPMNLRKIEQKHLYHQMINSFYTQADTTNNSSIINPKNLFQTNFPDGSVLNVGQLHPEQVVSESINKQRKVSRERSKDQTPVGSRYSVTNSIAFNNFSAKPFSHINPYQDVNLSQIEQTQKKKDYSPTITTSKYDLRRIPEYPQTINPQNTTQIYQKRESSLVSDKRGSGRRSEGGVKSRSINQKMRQGQMSTTKAELQRQLHSKQKELVDLKKMLSTQSVQQQRSSVQGRRGRVTFEEMRGSQERISSKSRSQASSKSGKRLNILKQIKDFHRSQPVVSTQTAVSSGNILLDQRANFLRDSAMSEEFSGYQSQILGVNPMGDESEVRHYQRINGREVSPPVRLGRE